MKSIKNKERIDELTKNIKIKITDPQVIKLDFNGSKKEFILAKYKNSTLSDELYELFEPITGLALDFMDYDSKGVIKHAKNKLPFIEKEIEAKIKYNSEGDILKIRKQ